MWTIFNPWGWLIAGLLICLAEMLLPGAFLLWIGIAAMATGGLLFALPSFPAFAPDSSTVILVFGGLALVSAWIGRMVYGTMMRPSGEAPFLNRRADGLVGRQFALDAAIVNGQGRIRVGDSVWSVRGPEAAAGAKVRVVAVEDGVHLRVELA